MSQSSQQNNNNQQKGGAGPKGYRKHVTFTYEGGQWKEVPSPVAGWGSQELRGMNPIMNSPQNLPKKGSSTSLDSSSSSMNTVQQQQQQTYKILAIFEGNFDEQGRRHGWGTLRVFRYVQKLSELRCYSIACRWETDVPQIDYDPCRMVEEIMKKPQELTVAIPIPNSSSQSENNNNNKDEAEENDERDSPSSRSNHASCETTPACEIYAESSRKLLSVYNGLMLAISQEFSTDRYKGLGWSLATQFQPHTLGEKHYIQGYGGIKYCGQWQMGERHGFGMERQIASGGLIYAGPYENGARNGVGLLFHHSSKTCLDATWNHGKITDCPGALHVSGYPISVIGRWSSDSTVSQGRLCRSNGASGIWETLFSEFDEQMQHLQAEVENMLAHRSPAASLNSSPNLSASKSSINNNNNNNNATSPLNLSTASSSAESCESRSDLLLPVQNAVDLLLTASSSLSVSSSSSLELFAQKLDKKKKRLNEFLSDVHTRLQKVKEEVTFMCEPIACVLATPQMRALLCVFQRCFLFSYGTCSPSGEEIGGGSMTAAEMAAATPPASSFSPSTSSSSSSSSSSSRTSGGKTATFLDESDDVFLAPKSCMSWCALAVRDIAQRKVFPEQFVGLSQQSHLLCIHRSKSSRDTDLELFQRSVDDVVALVISVRLRLMNLANSTIIHGGSGQSLSSSSPASNAQLILTGQVSDPMNSPPAPAPAPSPKNKKQGDDEETQEELFAAAFQDPSIKPFLLSGTPLSGSARAAVCAWDAVLDVSLAPLLKHASNVCKFENAKFLLATRRLCIQCSKEMDNNKNNSNKTQQEQQQQQQKSSTGEEKVTPRDLLCLLLPYQIMQVSLGEVASNNNTNNNFLNNTASSNNEKKSHHHHHHHHKQQQAKSMTPAESSLPSSTTATPPKKIPHRGFAASSSSSSDDSDSDNNNNYYKETSSSSSSSRPPLQARNETEEMIEPKEAEEEEEEDKKEEGQQEKKEGEGETKELESTTKTTPSSAATPPSSTTPRAQVEEEEDDDDDDDENSLEQHQELLLEQQRQKQQEEEQRKKDTELVNLVIDEFASELVEACKTLSNMFTDGFLSQTHITCASEATQSGLLFGVYRSPNPTTTTNSNSSSSTSASSTEKLRSNKAYRMRRVGTEGAISSLVAAVTSCCVQVRDASVRFYEQLSAESGKSKLSKPFTSLSYSPFAAAAAAAAAASSSASASSSSQKPSSSSSQSGAVVITQRLALSWGMRFVVSYAALMAKSPKSILPQLLLLDTICEAEAPESVLHESLDELTAMLLGIWRQDHVPAHAAVPLATGAVFPVTLIGQWAIRTLRTAILDVNTLANTPSPARAGAGAIFSCDVKGQLEDCLRETTRVCDVSPAPSYLSYSASSSYSSSPNSSSQNNNNSKYLDFSGTEQERTTRELQRFIDEENRHRISLNWFSLFRRTIRRPLVKDTGNAATTEIAESLFSQPTDNSSSSSSSSSSSGRGGSSSATAAAGGGNLSFGGAGIGSSSAGSKDAVSRHLVWDQGLASIIDRAFVLVRSASKSVVSRWHSLQDANASPAFQSPALASATTAAASASGSKPASAISAFATASASGSGSGTGGVGEKGKEKEQYTSLVVVTLQGPTHESELIRRVTKLAQVLKSLSVRTEIAVKTETISASSSSSDDSTSSSDDDLFASSGGGSGGRTTTGGGNTLRGKIDFAEKSVATRGVAKDRKLHVRFFASSLVEEEAGFLASPSLPTLSSSSPADSAAAFAAASAIDEDSLEEILEFFSARRQMFKNANPKK